MLRVVVLGCVVALFACGGDDDGGASGTGVSGFGGTGGTGALGGDGGVGGGVDSGLDGAIDRDAGIDAATVDASDDAAMADASATDAAIPDASLDAATLDATTLDATTHDAIVDAGANCRPGRYVGSLTGMYRSPAFGDGQTPFVLRSVDASDGTPGLELWLSPGTTPCAPGAAFCPDLVVTSGTAHLQFGGAFFPLVTDAVITGELDCVTGEFRGELVAADGFPLVFAGPMHAAYDAPSSTFTQGTWTVTESPCPNGAHCGGEGTWTATWTDASGNDADAGVVGDAGVVSDAGGTTVDAGTTDCNGGEVCRTSSLAMSYLPAGTGFCAPPGTSALPPACSTTDAPCGPSGGTCLALGVCLKGCALSDAP